MKYLIENGLENVADDVVDNRKYTTMTRPQKRVLIVTIWLKRKNVLSFSEKKSQGNVVVIFKFHFF